MCTVSGVREGTTGGDPLWLRKTREGRHEAARDSTGKTALHSRELECTCQQEWHSPLREPAAHSHLLLSTPNSVWALESRVHNSVTRTTVSRLYWQAEAVRAGLTPNP